MKVGVLFWGFKDLSLAAECAKKLKREHGIKEFYMQISVHEKTISLLDIFPEEIIRCDFDDLGFFYKWLSRNHRKNIIIVIDFWPFLASKNFSSNIDYLKKILIEPYCFLICCPRYYHDPVLEPQNRKFLNIADKTYDYFMKVHQLYEVALNSTTTVTLLSYAPCISLLNSICKQDFFAYKKVSFLTLVPNLLSSFPSIFISKNAFLEGLEQKIFELSSNLQAAKNKNDCEVDFRIYLKADTLNLHFNYKDISKKQKKSRFLISSSFERFYKIKSKDELKFLLWLVYLGILEYGQTFKDENEKNRSAIELFSSVPV